MRRMTRKLKAQRDKRRAQRVEWEQQEYPALIARALFAGVGDWVIAGYKGLGLYERYAKRELFEAKIRALEQSEPVIEITYQEWATPSLQTWDRRARESERHIFIHETLTEGDYREYRPETRQGKNRPGLGPSVLRQHPTASAADRHRFRTYARRR